MTDTITRTSPAARITRSIRYDVALVAAGVRAGTNAGESNTLGYDDATTERWRRLAERRGLDLPRLRRPSRALVAAHGLVSVIHGLLSWFLLALWLMAVVRGPFFGLVERGPFGPGTWGGPTLAGAWAVHAAVALPVIVLIPLALWGICSLHTALTRSLYGGPTQWWVLPATVLIAAAGAVLFSSWVRQI